MSQKSQYIESIRFICGTLNEDQVAEIYAETLEKWEHEDPAEVFQEGREHHEDRREIDVGRAAVC